MPQVYGGQMDTVVVGAASVTDFLVDSSSVSAVQFSLDGSTWSSSVTVLGASLSASVTDRGGYTQVTVTAVPTASGEQNFYIRAVTGSGTTAGFQTSLRAYVTTVGFDLNLQTTTGAGSYAAGPGSTIRAATTSSGSVVCGYTYNIVTSNIGVTARSKVGSQEFSAPLNSSAYRWQHIYAVNVGTMNVVTSSWILLPGTPSSTNIRNLVMDESGNIYIALVPSATGTLYLYNQGSATNLAVTISSTYTIVYARLNANGTWAWAKKMELAAAAQNMPALAVGNGQVLLANINSTSITWDGTTYTGASNASTVIKLSADTGTALSSVRLAAPSSYPWLIDTIGFIPGGGGNWYVNGIKGSYVTSNGDTGTFGVGGFLKMSTADRVLAAYSVTSSAGSWASGSSCVWADNDGFTLTVSSYGTTASTATYSGNTLNAADGYGSNSAAGNATFVFRLNTSGGFVWGLPIKDPNAGTATGLKLVLGTANGRTYLYYYGSTFTTIDSIAAISNSDKSVIWKAKPSMAYLNGTPWIKGVVEPSQGNVFMDVDGALTLTSADGTTTAVAASTSRLIGLSKDGKWGNSTFATGSVPGDSGLEPPTAPTSAAFPTTVLEDSYVSGSIDGYDPEQPTTAQLYNLEVWNPATGAWVKGGATGAAVVFSGKGTLNIPAQSGTIAANVTFSPTPNFYGTVMFFARWTAIADVVGPAVLRVGPMEGFTITYTNDPDQPTAPRGTMPEVNEDYTSVGVFSTTDADYTGSYTWQFSPQTSGTRSTTGSSIRVKDSHGREVGTANVQSQNNSARTANIRFIPDADWSGSASFSLRVSNGNLWSDWTVVNVSVTAVPDAPTAPTPVTVPNIDEDSYLDQTFTWSDADFKYEAGSGSYTVQLALAYGPVSWSNMDVGGTFDLGDVTLTLLSLSGDQDLTVTPNKYPNAKLRVSPKANWYGAYGFLLRIAKTGGPTTLYSPTSTVTGNIISVPDTPSRVTPRTMPKAVAGQTVSQVFSTFDPDPEDTTWTFEYSLSPLSGWTTAPLTIPGRGTLSVSDPVLSDQQATVTFAAADNGYGRYQFFLRVTDSSGRSSDPEMITGYVVGGSVRATLQRVDRTTSPATVRSICPLTSMSELNITTALDGPGAATLAVSAAEIAVRCTQTSKTVSQLLDPGAVELLITIGMQPLWVGPVSGWEYDAAADGTVRIYASGLLSYLESRVISSASPTGSTDFINTDQSTIVWSLINSSQAEAGGALALTDGTVGCGTNSTVTWDNTSTVSEALSELRQQAGAAEVWADPDRTIRAAATRGTDKRHLVRLSEGLATTVTRFSRSDDVITAAVVLGAEYSGGRYSGTYVDSAAAAAYGRLVRVVEAPQLLSNASCVALAREVVLRHKDGAESVSIGVVIDPLRPFTITDLEVGDVVTVDVNDPVLGRVRRDVRIINLSIDLVSDASDAFNVTLDVEPAIYVDGVLQGSRSRHVAELFETAYEALYQK